MQTCWKCGKTYDDDANFCKACGSPSKSEKICWKCGAKLSEDSKFCAKCGESFDKAEQTVKPIKESNEVLERFDYSYEAVGAKKKDFIKGIIISVVVFIISIISFSYFSSKYNEPFAFLSDSYDYIKFIKKFSFFAIIALIIGTILDVILYIFSVANLGTNKMTLYKDRIEGVGSNSKPFTIKLEQIQEIKMHRLADSMPNCYPDFLLSNYSWIRSVIIVTSTGNYECYCRTPESAVMRITELLKKGNYIDNSKNL